MKYLFFLTVCLAAGNGRLSAQDTCKVFSVPNPHDAPMTISSVFIADTVNFTVEPLRSVPFDITATEIWDARVCIKARDGQRYSTTIRYMTTHGQASFALSMVAPATSGAPSLQLRAHSRVFPLPARDFVSIELPDARPGEVSALVADVLGRIVATNVQLVVSRDSFVRVDVRDLATGTFIYTFESAGRVIGRARVVVAN